MFRCPHCKKTNSVKAGLRKNIGGWVQKYLCNECGKMFVNRKGFEHCHTKPEIIVDALDLRAKGMSLGKIVDHINQKYKTNIQRGTVLRWQKKFGEMIDHFTASFQLWFSENAHADETYLRKKGHKKDEFVYYWDVIDYDTKFLIADHISVEKNESEGLMFIRKIRENLERFPIYIHTDNSFDYPPAIRAVFPRKQVKHVRFPAWKHQFKNNPIERFHNTLRENYKVMRKFQSADSAYAYLKFFRNYYNFLRPHKTLNKRTPAEAAGFGRWNWWSLIRAIIIRKTLLPI
ncbi:MAG: DDE-type integrase/transposase/recombinase [Nanoarchaeota archaeon]|nr:DDE-type integrase/transposase/recombinase [Nanoarchaeota archaeon]